MIFHMTMWDYTPHQFGSHGYIIHMSGPRFLHKGDLFHPKSSFIGVQNPERSYKSSQCGLNITGG